jgi:uncharacterized protein YeeX (DUF496 family)
MATSSAREIIEIIREDQRRREDRVLKAAAIVHPRRQIFELACEHFRDRGEGKG